MLLIRTAFAFGQLGFQFRDLSGGSIQRSADFCLVLFQRLELFLSLRLPGLPFFQLPRQIPQGPLMLYLQLLYADLALGQLRLKVGNPHIGGIQLLVSLV